MHTPVSRPRMIVPKRKFIREFTNPDDASFAGTIIIHTFLNRAYMFYENMHGTTAGSGYESIDGRLVKCSENQYNEYYDMQAIDFIRNMVNEQVDIRNPYMLEKLGFHEV